MPLGFRKDDLSVSVKSAVSPKRSETEEETQDSMITTFSPDIFLVHFLPLFPSETIKPISPVLFYRFSFNFLGLSHKRRWKVVEQKGETGSISVRENDPRLEFGGRERKLKHARVPKSEKGTFRKERIVTHTSTFANLSKNRTMQSSFLRGKWMVS